MRELITSPWYKRTFEPNWILKRDANQIENFANTAGGHRISYSVNAKVTGKKGDVLVVDDANDAKKVRSKVDRLGVNDWHDQAFSGRMIDEMSSPEVIGGQRLHKEDLLGHCKAKGGWECLALPEEFNPEFAGRNSVWQDSRTFAGEWLRPARFGPNEKREAIARMGSRGYTGQHNQRPQDAEGSMFKRAWFLVVEAGPAVADRVRYWDKAHSENS